MLLGLIVACNIAACQTSFYQEVQPVAIVSPVNHMTLTPTGKKNLLGNPLYQLNLYAGGKLIKSYMTVSGRAYTQGRDRNKSGTEAPLPDGVYDVDLEPVPGEVAEAGDLFLGITPFFRTNRSYLGIHYDPSYEKANGEDGTSGCIGLTNRKDLVEVLQFVRTYKPDYLNVDIL